MNIRELLLQALELCEPPAPKKTLDDIISEGKAAMSEAVEAVISKHETEIAQKITEKCMESACRAQSLADIDSGRAQRGYFEGLQGQSAQSAMNGLTGLGSANAGPLFRGAW